MMSLRHRQMRPTSVLGSTDTAVRSKESASGTVVPLDFESVAGLIDIVAGNDPPRLSTLLTILWDGCFKEEARRVLEAAVTCRDPLSDLGTICTDALRTLADLEKLVRAQNWRSLISVVGHQDPRACALLNACELRITRLPEVKQAPYKAARARLEKAATLERTARSGEIQAFAGLRAARCPKIWALYEKWRDTE